MKKHVIYLFLVVPIFLSSCGTFREVFKLKESKSAEIVRSSTSDSLSVRVDKTVTTIRKTVDTVVTTPERTVSQSTTMNQDSLIKGINAIQSDLVDVKLTLDSQTGLLTAVATVKPQLIPVHMDVEQTVRNDIQEGVRRVQENNESIKTESSSKRVEKEPNSSVLWAVVAAALAIVLVVWLLRRR